MKPKSYFNNQSPKPSMLVTAQKVSVYQRTYEQFRHFVQKRPKKVLLGMLLFATLNFGLMLYMINRDPPAPLVPPDIARNSTERGTRPNIGAEFSISNYMKISKLKDSLDYLMKKKSLSGEDSLLFIRICNEYSKLDPDFSQQVNKHINKTPKSKNHETTTDH